VRRSVLGSYGILEAVYINVKSLGILFIRKLPDVLPTAIFALLPFVYLGGKLREAPSIKTLGIATGIFGLMAFVNHYPIAYVMGDIGPDRALAPISFYLVILMVMVALHIGSRLEKKRLPLIGLTIFINLAVAFNQYELVSKYSTAVDARIEKALAGCDDAVLELDPLPESGMLYSGKLSTNPKFFSNEHFRDGLGLECDVVVKE